MRKHRLLMLYILLYLLINMLFLTCFPFVHSDEPWLSGLTRNMAETGSLSVTETFFDLKPRYPHAIKTLFHLLQMPFMLLGYSAFAFRLMSLLFGCGCLALFYHILLRATQRPSLALLGTVLLSVDVQFVYASHFARPEIIILLCMLGVYALLFSGGKLSVLYAALLTGLSIGLHPNSFLVAALGGFLLLCKGVAARRLPWKDMGVYVGVVALFAGCFLALSYSFDGDFLRHYLAYGSEFEVDSSFPAKLREIFPYFQRLFHRTSGTYYTPDIRPQLLLFAAILPLGAAAAIKLRSGQQQPLLRPIFAMAGILAGMTIVGRFSQPYVVFFFPFAYLLLCTLVGRATERLCSNRGAALVLGGLYAVVGGLSCSQILPAATQPYQYDSYLANIASVVPPDAKAIANLNAEYHFDNGRLLDYRNLSYLEERGLSIGDYVRRNQVEYLIISDEIEFIHSKRPTWNGIYGNINYLDDLRSFLRDECTLLKTFTDNVYGIRIVRYQNTTDFNISIYRVNTAGPTPQ